MNLDMLPLTIAEPDRPQLVLPEQAGLRDFFQVYDAHYDEIMAAMERSAAEAGDALADAEQFAHRVSPAQAVAQERRSRELQRRAIEQGEWAAYEADLIEQGARYAQSGLSFQSFRGRLGAFRQGALPYLLAAYAPTPERLASALHGMATLADLVMGASGQGYVETKEQLVRAQEREFGAIATRRRAEDKFKGLLESAPDAVVIVNRAGQMVQANSQTETLFGYPRPDLIGQPVEMLVPERFRGAHPGQLSGYFVDPQSRRMAEGLPVFGLRRDGSEFPAEIRLSPLTTEDGPQVTAAIRNITDRVTAEAQFRGLLEATQDGIAIVDESGGIVRVNAQMEKLFGYSRPEMIGANIDLLVPERLRAGHPTLRAGYFRDARVRPMGAGLDLYGRRKDGSEFPVDISLSPLESETGRLVTAAIRDGTVRQRLAHEQLLREANAALLAANDELEAFSYSVSHDLRAPLRAVIGFSAAVLEDFGPQLGPDGQRQLGIIQSAARDMGTLVDDLLAFSRLGRQQMRPVEIDMTGLAASVWSDLASQSPERRVSIQLGTLAAAHGDRSMLRQVWVNLLANAFKFTRTRPLATVEIASRLGEQEVVYSIKDNGVGFDMRYVDKLFGVFQRLHGLSEFEGTGIGLSIVKRVVARHGGRVWAEGQVDGGATFYFALPITEEAHGPS